LGEEEVTLERITWATTDHISHNRKALDWGVVVVDEAIGLNRNQALVRIVASTRI